MSRKASKCITVILGLVCVLTLLSSCIEVTVNEPMLSNSTMASEVDDVTYEVVTACDTFAVDTPVIYLITQLRTAPKGTNITAEWWYVDQEIFIDSATLESTEVNQTLMFSLSRPDKGWPTGAYQVKLYLNDEEVETVDFTVE